MRSAMVVDPRTSANRKLHSISAPPWCFAMKSKHDVHIVGFLSDGRLPIIRMTGAAGPANGAAHNMQRGLVREATQNAADLALHRVATREEVPPELLGGLIRFAGPFDHPGSG